MVWITSQGKPLAFSVFVVYIGIKWGKVGEMLVLLRLITTHMFIGEFTHQLDDKFRLSVPKKFRADLGDGAVLTRGLDHCLFLYTTREWQKLAEKLAALPFAQANTRAFSRLMLAGAFDLTLDSQGRVLIPDYLRDFASLGKSVVVAGLYNRLEIWNEESWRSYKQKTESESTEIAEQMANLGV